jgi:hypothetical protein
MGKEDEIKVIAYRIWQEEGFVHGHDCENWLKAEVIWEEKQKTGAVSTNVKTEPDRPPEQRKGNKLSRKKR